MLEDHGCVAHGFLALAGATGDVAWLDRARLVLDHALEKFRAVDGGFHDTSATPRRWSPGRGTRPTAPARQDSRPS